MLLFLCLSNYYFFFFYKIYSDENNTNLDGKEWVECDIDNCGKWVILFKIIIDSC